ncbi:glycoside hydrolase family 45 protein [Colletotrichum incanum]|uniref:Cellulase n=1 Tax=Colletotrichum incanum TaxID=1573173 RepID=A0A167D0D4_COLIC|nr:glycoside hydrolase family 45 protein [Colletotrichum incanum]
MQPKKALVPFLPLVPLLPLLPLLPFSTAQFSGTGSTTRYWDCCKPSCAWPGKSNQLASGPVTTCDRNDNPLADGGATRSGCDSGGGAYMCSSTSPWAISDDLAYGWAAVRISGGTEAQWCCACYELTFTSGPVAGKRMIVQATNTGGDLGQNHFDIAIPGGGVGLFNACTDQYGAPANGWGQRYGGISSRSECNGFPEKLKAGCYWRFDWFKGADNPAVSFKQVTCPAEITNKSGCRRQG